MSYYEQYFPSDFLSDYITEKSYGLKRLQTYALFRFLSTAEKEQKLSAKALQKQLNYTLSKDSFSVISNYLLQDCYFSPAFRENSFDAIYLYDAIYMVESNDTNGLSTVKELIFTTCPDISTIDLTDASANLSLAPNDELSFYAALTLLAIDSPALLSGHLPKLAPAYHENLNFTYEDFVLYSFMDEYFEIKNCRDNGDYQELIDTLITATLKAFDTTLEECVTNDAARQLSHPSSKFAGLYRFGALEFAPSTDSAENIEMMKHLLEYAVTYELRNNLFDFHLDEDRIITLKNWKEKLRWYHIQYSNAYELALSSFYTAILSKKLLKLQFERNLSDL